MAKGWASFEAVCVPAGASAGQRRAMKAAFYGGASVLLHSVMNALDPSSEPTARDVSMLASIDAELREFAGPPRPSRLN